MRSFNADKRYDQFVREQIAGDEIEPGNPEMSSQFLDLIKALPADHLMRLR